MIPSLEQNGLRQLEAKIKGLPIQDSLQRRRQLYRGAKAEAQQCHASLDAILGQVHALRTILARPEVLVEAEQKRVVAARAKAQELIKLVRDADPDAAKFSEKLDSIKRSTKALSDDVKASWVQICQDHHDRAEALRPIAGTLSSVLVQRIEVLDRLLRIGTTTPPTSTTDVQAIVEARVALASAIASMNMDGPIEKFLRDSQLGNGDLRAVLDPKVREYLDAHPTLWNSLRVVLS